MFPKKIRFSMRMRHLKISIDFGRVGTSSQYQYGKKTHQQKCDFDVRLVENREQNSGKKLITAEKWENVRKWRFGPSLREGEWEGEEKEKRILQGQ